MYITYHTMQWSQHDDEQRFLNQHVRPPVIIPSNLPKPTAFMPKKLVRVSDMQVVPGANVDEGYCALSYAFNQSGEIIVDRTTGKHKRIDHGKHKIIRKGRVLSEKTKCVTFQNMIQRIAQDFNIKYIWYDQMCLDHREEEKNHEIQQMYHIYRHAYCTVCLVPEFHVDVFVLQLNNRQQEIKYGKVVEQAILESQWFKRLWTLQEALNSSSLLFVGEKVHAWWVENNGLRDINILMKPMISEAKKWNAATLLFHAHIRKCSNEYDRVFALANLFPDIINNLTINYHQPLIDLMIHFYGKLAQKDLTVMCFGGYNKYRSLGQQKVTTCNNNLSSHVSQQQDDNYLVPIQKYKHVLPSWVGVCGEHLPNNGLKTFFQNYTLNGKIMRVTCTGIITTTTDQPSIKINNNPFILTLDDFISLIPPPDHESFNDENSYRFWKLAMLVRFPGHHPEEGKIIILPTISIQTIKELLGEKMSTPATSNNSNHNINMNGCKRSLSRSTSNKNNSHHDHEQILNLMTQELRLLSHFMPTTIQKEDLFWFKTTGLKVPYSEFRIDLTEKLDDALSEYVILSGVPFKNDNPRNEYYPVLKKEKNNIHQEHYRAIGLCKISNTQYFFSNYTLPEEHTFSIE